MYDPRSEPREFIGSTRSEAVAKACSFFAVEEGELRIVELDAALVAGIAGRSAIVAGRAGLVRARPAARERAGHAERVDRNERAERPRAPEPLREESIGTAEGELSSVGEFVRGALERMDLGPFTISESEERELVVVGVAGSAASRLRTGESRGGEALQLLANQVVLRSDRPERRVVVDVEGDAGQREVFLERIAERAARRAKEMGRAVALEPMNGHDRRVIHVSLRDTPDIATMSIGEGRYRQVVVVPKGAPEYEEARRSTVAKE